MPYTQLPQIDDRKSEKMAVLLTVENMAGLLAIAVPTYLATASWDAIPRILALMAAAVLGVALTVPVGGLALYARLLWRLRGWVWLQLHGADIQPDQLPGAARRAQRGVVLPAQGVARVVRRPRGERPLRPTAQRVPSARSQRSRRQTREPSHADLRV
jgi:hypothetical protein